MTQKEFIKLLERYNKGKCTFLEKNLVEKWCDTILASEKRTVEYSLEDRAKMFAVIKASREKAFSVSPHRPPLTRLAMAAAAVVVLAVLCIALYFINARKNSEGALSSTAVLKGANDPIFNNTSKPIAVSLPDGTEVSLYPKSKLSAVTFTKKERKMRLEGKGFFKVAHDANRPFFVFTDKLITKVLGTSFTINAMKGSEQSVEVKTGKVAVFRTHTKENNGYQLPDFYVTITPNQQVRLDTIQRQLVKSLVAHPMLIQSPELKESAAVGEAMPTARPMSFEGAPVIEIFKTLEVAYGVEIKYDKDKIANCILTVSMDGDDLFTRLQVVCNAINGKYHVEETKLIISSPGCK